MVNEKYKYRNSSERNAIITDLNANTLYDFAVRVVIGSRKSEWSMTTSQMTMETSWLLFFLKKFLKKTLIVSLIFNLKTFKIYMKRSCTP